MFDLIIYLIYLDMIIALSIVPILVCRFIGEYFYDKVIDPIITQRRNKAYLDYQAKLEIEKTKAREIASLEWKASREERNLSRKYM